MTISLCRGKMVRGASRRCRAAGGRRAFIDPRKCHRGVTALESVCSRRPSTFTETDLPSHRMV